MCVGPLHSALFSEPTRTGSLKGHGDPSICTPCAQIRGRGALPLLNTATGRPQGGKQGSLTTLSTTQPGKATLYSAFPKHQSQTLPGSHIRPLRSATSVRSPSVASKGRGLIPHSRPAYLGHTPINNLQELNGPSAGQMS